MGSVSADEGTGSAVAVKGRLKISVGGYQAVFDEGPAWTLRSVAFQKTTIISETGANQTVLNTGRQWIGTGHGGEIIERVCLEVDGVSSDLMSEMPEKTGTTFKVIKDSLMGPYRNHAVVKMTAQGIDEDFSFTVVDHTAEEPFFMYVFMHCFHRDMSDWIANLADSSKETGLFREDNTFTLKKDVSSLILFSKTTGMGAVVVYPEPYSGFPDASNMFWNRPFDNKHYFKIKPPLKTGERARYRCRLIAFTAEADEWEKTGQALIESASFKQSDDVDGRNSPVRGF